MESFRPIGLPENLRIFEPHVREVKEAILRSSMELEQKERAFEGQRIMAHVIDHNPEKAQQFLALFHTKNSLEWLKRLGFAIHDTQQDRDLVYVTPVPFGHEVYLNTHDGRLYGRYLVDKQPRTHLIESFDELQAVLSGDIAEDEIQDLAA